VARGHFNERIARRDLVSYRKSGPGVATRLLRDLLIATNAVDGDLLDVGSGIGGLIFELLEHGVGKAIAVDASSAYLAAAKEEAGRRGVAGRIELVHGDFVAVASTLPPTAVVTMDRVICCYPSYAALLEESLRHAARYFAFSYPRDVWFVRWGIAAENAVRRIRGDQFRAFIHSPARMTHVIQSRGFKLAGRRQSRQWVAEVHVRLDH
jgi:SAM-dependent methyltransferase